MTIFAYPPTHWQTSVCIVCVKLKIKDFIMSTRGGINSTLYFLGHGGYFSTHLVCWSNYRESTHLALNSQKCTKWNWNWNVCYLKHWTQTPAKTWNRPKGLDKGSMHNQEMLNPDTARTRTHTKSLLISHYFCQQINESEKLFLSYIM